MSSKQNSTVKTFVFAIVMCVSCSLILTLAKELVRDKQLFNQKILSLLTTGSSLTDALESMHISDSLIQCFAQGIQDGTLPKRVEHHLYHHQNPKIKCLKNNLKYQVFC